MRAATPERRDAAGGVRSASRSPVTVITEEDTCSCQASPIAVSLRCKSEQGRPSPMSLGQLLASIRERRRRSAQQPYEAGAQIRRRLQELLAVPTPARVETHSTNACKNDPTGCRDGRLHWS